LSTISDSGVEVSVVMPCLNEAETVGICVDKAITAFAQNGILGEVIVADNGSTDGSPEIATSHGAQVSTIATRGYGAALAGGIEAANGQFIVMGDADDSYDYSELPKFVDKLRRGADLVVGCRFPRGGGHILPGAMPPLHRWIGTPVLTFLGCLFFQARITDINCGMRGFKKCAYSRMALRSPGMEFASEMVMKASLLGLRIEEVPITLHPDGRRRAPHLRTWRDGWRHLRFMLLYSPLWLFFLPGMSLFAIGLCGVVLLALGPLSIGPVVFSLNTHVVSAMATLLGFQILSFGVFAKRYAQSQGLLPLDHSSGRTRKFLRLEYAVIAGVLAALAGVGLLAWAVAIWRETGFGILDPLEMPRVVIPSVTLIVLGAQLFFSGFILGLLTLSAPDSSDPS